MNVVAGSAKKVSLTVYLLDGSGLFAGTTIARLYDVDADQYWSTDGGGAWEAEGDITTWPAGTSEGHGDYSYEIPAAALTAGLSLRFKLDDNDTVGSVTAASADLMLVVRASDLAEEDDISGGEVVLGEGCS